MKTKQDFKKNNLDENMYRKSSSTIVEAMNILKEPITAHSQHQNGVEERMNCTLTEMTRSVLCRSRMSFSFWAETVSTAIYLLNRSPTAQLKDITPYEK